MSKWYAWVLVGLLTTAAVASDYVVINKNKSTQSCTGDHLNVTVNANGCKVKVDGQCDDLNVRGRKNHIDMTKTTGAVLIPGRNNQVVFEGGVDSVNVGGDENTLTVSGPTTTGKPLRIEVSGGGNVVLWSRSHLPTAPDWVDNGTKNLLKPIPQVRDALLLAVAIVVVVGACVFRTRRLQQPIDAARVQADAVEARAQSASPSRHQVDAVATSLQAARGRVDLMQQGSPATAAELLAAVDKRLPSGVTLDQEQMDVDAGTLQLSGQVAGDHPLDRLARLQQQLQQPPFQSASLNSSNASGAVWSFHMEVRFKSAR